MYDELIEWMNQGKYEDVIAALKQYDINEYTETLVIIAISAFLAVEDYEAAKGYLQMGLQMNPKNAELYLLLGNYYERHNRQQAHLCYENAELYCDNEQDRAVIQDFKSRLEEEGVEGCRKTAIVILSYNAVEMTQYCIESIRRNNLPSAYEIIVVDNASTDGSVEWLEQQEDIRLIKNTENKGFPYGCNQGIKAAEPEADILLLNNDTIVFPNSLFWLRMGLYEEERVGAVGSMTNYASNGQIITEKYDTIQEYEKFALKNNVFCDNPYELKFYLVGFAVLIRREVIDAVGLLDVRFSPGQFEDDDLGLRICQAGWKNLLCHNSFIYHFGGGAGENRPVWKKLNLINREKCREKWSFDITRMAAVEKEIVRLLGIDGSRKVTILQVGCGIGATLARIQYEYPSAQVYGIEPAPELAKIGSRFFNIACTDIEKQNIPFEEVQFDYIILSGVLERMHHPKEAVQRLACRLREGGVFLCSVLNFMYAPVLSSLIRGEFEYGADEIADKSQLRFFTLHSISGLYAECGFQVEKVSYSTNGIEEKDYADFLENVRKIPDCADKEQFLAHRYVFRAVPSKD